MITSIRDAEEAHAGHVADGLFDASGITGVVEGVGELLGESDAMIELPQEDQARIGGERVIGGLDLDGSRSEEIEFAVRDSV